MELASFPASQSLCGQLGGEPIGQPPLYVYSETTIECQLSALKLIPQTLVR